MTLAAAASPADRPAPPPRAAMRRHSRLVRVLRWVLPAMMVGAFAVMVGYIFLHAARSRAARPLETPTEIRMINPRFAGRDDRGRAFNLSARQASRADGDAMQVELVGPVVTLDVDGVHPSTVTADHGTYDEDKRLLHLKGHVHMDDSRASAVATDEALVDTKAGTVNGSGPIAAQTNAGSIQAHSYSVYDKGNRVVYRGGVHARLNSR